MVGLLLGAAHATQKTSTAVLVRAVDTATLHGVFFLAAAASTARALTVGPRFVRGAASVAASTSGMAEGAKPKRVPDAESLKIHRQYMDDVTFARFAAGDFGIYGGKGMAEGTKVPDDLVVVGAGGAPRAVSRLSVGARPVVLNFGSCS